MRIIGGLVVVGVIGLAGLAHAQCAKAPYCTIAAPPPEQTIAEGGVIGADACGSVKRIAAGGAVTTDTTNTFSAPTGGSDGCWMAVCNTGGQNITLDNNANFKSAGGANVVLTPDDCVSVVQTGTVWRQVSALLAN